MSERGGFRQQPECTEDLTARRPARAIQMEGSTVSESRAGRRHGRHGGGMERKPDGDVSWALHPGQDLGGSPVAAQHGLTRNLMESLQLPYGVETTKGGTEAVYLSGAHKRDLSPTGEWWPVLRSLSSARSEPGHSFTSLSYGKPLMYARYGCGCLEHISDRARQ